MTPVHDNPYAPPSADLETAVPELVEVRSTHMTHETSIKSIGMLYYFGGGSLALGGLSMLLVSLERGQDTLGVALASAIMFVLSAGSILLGYGLRRLKPWARIPVAIISAIGLLGFPIGTLVNGYILYLILSRKGRRILAPDYAEVVARTPEIRYRASIVAWILLGLLWGLLVLALIPSIT